MSKQKKHIDWVMAESLTAGDVVLATTLLHMLLQELPNNKVLFNRYYQEKKWTELEGLAHKLQGACCYAGVPLLKDATKTLEQAVGHGSLTGIESALATLNDCIDALLAEAEKDPRL